MSTVPGGQPTLGRYEIIREIARSNDVVWEGRDPQMNRRVAVKELALPPNVTGQARRDRIDRFYREARAAGAMSHPNIVTIHEVGEDRGRYFIAMEYLEGQTLRERLTLGGPMPLSEVSAVTVALCDALEYAHARGVIHRDIKPDNIHVLPGGRIKLTDFGIARITHEDQLTVAGQVFGTPSYMSPEQIVARPIDARSDQFSLAIVVFEMITGVKPFTGDSVATITYRIVNEAAPQVTGAPSGVDAVLHRALSKEPTSRYPTVMEFRAAFAAAAAARTGPYAAQPQMQQPAPPPTAFPFTQPTEPQATAQYSDQTQFGIAPGHAAQGAPPQFATAQNGGFTGSQQTWHPQGPPENAQQKTIVTVLISLILVTGAALGGGYALSRAFQNYNGESASRQVAETYGKAANLYHFGDFESAAAAFKQVRLSPQATDAQRNKAEKGEVFCYRELGHQAQKQNDLSGAARWYQSALSLEPSDGNARTELDAVQRLQQNSGTASSAIAPDASGTPAPPMSFGSPAPTPAPSVVTANDFTNANAQNDGKARPYLNAGRQAEYQGNLEKAQEYYRDAMAAGPGSQAAIEAGARLQQSITAHPDNSLINNNQ